MLRRVSRSHNVHSGRGSSSAWEALDVAALVLVTGLAAVLRFVRLSDPRSLIFDETYYARDACWYAYASRSLCGIDAEQTMIHPPLGKHLIAIGIRAFGYDAFGWRVASAIAGTLMVAVLFVLARRLLTSAIAATLTAGLLAVDWLGFVQSRIAMLDVFAALFGLVAILLVVIDRDAAIGDRRRWWRPLRLAAGVAAGAAAASKWSGALATVTVIALVVSGVLSAQRTRAGGRGPGSLRFEVPSIALYLIVIPMVVYALTYVGRLDGTLFTLPWSPGAWTRALWDRQTFMLSFHSGLEVTHAYQSPAWSWPLVKRPVSYYFETTPAGAYMEIFAAGNPLVWWSSLAALAYVAGRWLRRGGGGGAEGVVLAAFLIGYLPWLVVAGDRSALFLFYLLPVVPFMCLALGYVAAQLERIQGARPAIGLFCVTAVALFAFYYPLLAKRPLPRDAWLNRIWIFDDCARPSGASVGASDAGRAIGSTRTNGDTELPPKGWCWI
jgi:dolichyl-phosphate-mannose-protein mannosyltransferase